MGRSWKFQQSLWEYELTQLNLCSLRQMTPHSSKEDFSLNLSHDYGNDKNAECTGHLQVIKILL